MARRFRWVSIAPFGVPVVPLVYCSTAMSPRAGAGCAFGSLRAATTSRQRTAPAGTRPAVSAALASRAFLTGKRRAIRLAGGMAAVRSTAMTVRTPMSGGNASTVAASLSQTTAIVAPWSAN